MVDLDEVLIELSDESDRPAWVELLVELDDSLMSWTSVTWRAPGATIPNTSGSAGKSIIDIDETLPVRFEMS